MKLPSIFGSKIAPPAVPQLPAVDKFEDGRSDRLDVMRQVGNALQPIADVVARAYFSEEAGHYKDAGRDIAQARAEAATLLAQLTSLETVYRMR